MSKEKLIIVEGPQGTGKTTITNWLREKIAYTNLYRLTGSKYNTEEEAKKRSEVMYNNLVNYIYMMEDSGINLLFDRIFVTEYVYCKLGIRKYEYSDIFKKLIKKLDLADFDTYIINLKLKDANLYEERTKRDKPKHHNVVFCVENSMKQQNTYSEVMDEIKKLTKNMKVVDIYTDDFEKEKAELANLLGIEGVL